MNKVVFEDLGNMAYKAAWDYQEKLFAEVVAQKSANRKLPEDAQIKTTDHLLFVEHPPVFTLGKSGNEAHLLINHKKLQEENIDCLKVECFDKGALDYTIKARLLTALKRMGEFK